MGKCTSNLFFLNSFSCLFWNLTKFFESCRLNDEEDDDEDDELDCFKESSDENGPEQTSANEAP